MAKQGGYSGTGGATGSKVAEFPLTSGFKYGYRNREDITTLPNGVLVVGSQNVLTNQYNRIAIVQGYTLDGQRSMDGDPILSWHDWLRHQGDERHLRAGFNVLGSAGKLQFRYVATAGDIYAGNVLTQDQVVWVDLMTGLGNGTTDRAVRFTFAPFWDFNDELKSLLLFVNGSSNIFMWSGGVTTIASTTANTITKNGTDSWAQGGFLNTATYTQEVVINGTTYTYTGGATTTTLTGVTPSPAAEVANTLAVQKVVTTPNSGISGIPATFKNNIITTVSNQVYLSGDENQSVYVSKTNEFKDFTFSSPRVIGEGAILTLDGVPTAMAPQKSSVFISAGDDFWYNTTFSLSSDGTAQNLFVSPLKTTSKQASISQNATTQIKNNIFYISKEPLFNSLGTSPQYFEDPQVTDLSFPIVNDVNSYNLNDASVAYSNKYAYVCIPKQSVVRIYNMTNMNVESQSPSYYWEAPITYPISGISIIEGELYGHGYGSSNTYKLFTGYDFDTRPYIANAFFSYENLGIRNMRKSSTSTFADGYISTNTVLKLGLKRELRGGGDPSEFLIYGNDSTIVEQSTASASLGKVSLGKKPLGGVDEIIEPYTLNLFHVYKTYTQTPYFNEQKQFSTYGVNQIWELLSFGSNAMITGELPTDITQ